VIDALMNVWMACVIEVHATDDGLLQDYQQAL